MSRRQFLNLSAGLSAGALLAACAGPVGAPPGPAAPAGEQPTTQISVFYFAEGEGDVQSHAFMEEHPEVSIELIPGGAEPAKLDGMIAAGTPPDIFAYAEVDFISHLDAGNLLNLQPLVDVDTEFDLADYFPDVVATSQSPAGDLYGLGPDFGAQLLYYNKTLFDGAGLSYPDETWTWQKMHEAAQQLTTGEGAAKQYGALPHNWWAVQFPLVWQNGGDVFSADGAQCLMDAPEAVEALGYMLSYVRQELAPSPQQISGMGMESGQLFGAGRAGMFPGGHWEYGGFGEAAGFEWDVTSVPQQKQAATFLHQAIWGVSAATNAPEVCWEWIKLTCGPEQSEIFVTLVGGQSTLISVAERLASDPPDAAVGTGVAKVWKALYNSARGGRSYSRVRGFLEIIDSVWSPAIDMLWSGEYTPEQAGQEITEGANAILQREA
jgi:multiple sugar transport system substrate-binding protein